MPELPEVETVLRGIKPYLVGKKVSSVILRHKRLRWPIPSQLSTFLAKQKLLDIERRSKYLIFKFATGNMLIHLGMSGRLGIITKELPAHKHDHVDFIFSANLILRYNDPRRFGAILWSPGKILAHPLLANIGPEPLTAAFSGKYLWKIAQNKKIAVKILIMDSKVVAGIGNIYATEALFSAGILPDTSAENLSLQQCTTLVKACKAVLKKAIKKGGTTLKDYRRSDGTPGHFHLSIQIYGKENKPCPKCGELLRSKRIGQRSSTYCPLCQR